MSTLATADLSDSENDGDFIPDLPKTKVKRKSKSKTDKKKVKKVKLDDEESDSATSSSSSSSDEGDEDEEVGAENEKKKLDEIEQRKKKAREEFERMKVELNGTPLTVDKVEEGKKEVELVEVKRARRFAGEIIYEIVKLKADDPEAIAYLSKHNSTEGKIDPAKDGMPSTSLSTFTSTEDVDKPSSIPASISTAEPVNVSNLPSSTLTSTSQIQPPPRPKGPPIRRKPRQSLESMSAALDKGKKMTTLEKSQMDWKSHTSSSGIQDELNSNRKNGSGYLDKKDFLDRVGERRSNGFEGKR